MVNPLLTRVGKLEAKVTPPETALCCWRVVCDEGDEVAGEALARSRGYDPDNDGHLLMLHSIVTPAVQRAESRPPYLIA